MPEFSFRVRGDAEHDDSSFFEFPDLAAARVSAVQLAAAILRDEPWELLREGDWQLELKDASGRTYFTVNVAAIEATASRSGSFEEGGRASSSAQV